MTAPPSVVHLSESDIGGGAARAASRLHDGLLRRGVHSQMFVARKLGRDPHTTTFAGSNSASAKLRRWYRRAQIRSRSGEHALGAVNRIGLSETQFGSESIERRPPSDIYNLHWITGFVDAREFVQSVTAPTVWTLHDMNPFTGGCHYSLGCSGFTQECGRCPALRSTAEKDQSRWEMHSKKVLRNAQLTIVAPSEWMAREAQGGSLFNGHRLEVIPYGIEHREFAPAEREQERAALGIPIGQKVIAMMAAGVNDGRKGVSEVLTAMNGESFRDAVFLLIGSGEIARQATSSIFQVRDLEVRSTLVKNGHFQSAGNLQLSRLLSIADLFVLWSKAENLAQTGLEALACGTPIIASDVGGNREIVGDSGAGVVISFEDSRALKEAAGAFIRDPCRLQTMSMMARRRALMHFNLELQAARYESLYRSISAT